MSSKNRSFAAGLADAIDPTEPVAAAEAPRPARMGVGVLSGRSNRLAELASGALITRSQELVDPARCKMWSEHNRDYGLLNEERCADLIDTLKAKGHQEFPAIVRRVKDDPDFDFEVICGARRHWSITWLRNNHYPEFRFLVEPRELTDEEAFRIADLENRAREDLTDIERARDYLRALDRHYGGRQKTMAERMNVTETWLSRYLDLSRLPDLLMVAFPDRGALGIRHAMELKALLKPEERRDRAFAEAARIAKLHQSGEAGAPAAVKDIIRALARAADAPKKSGSPKKSGKPAPEVFASATGAPVLRIDAKGKKELGLTLLLQAGGTRQDAERAFAEMLQRYWPAPSGSAT